MYLAEAGDKILSSVQQTEVKSVSTSWSEERRPKGKDQEFSNLTWSPKTRDK